MKAPKRISTRQIRIFHNMGSTSYFVKIEFWRCHELYTFPQGGIKYHQVLNKVKCGRWQARQGQWNLEQIKQSRPNCTERRTVRGDKIKCFHYSFGLPFPSFPFISLSPLSLSLGAPQGEGRESGMKEFILPSPTLQGRARILKLNHDLMT